MVCPTFSSAPIGQEANILSFTLITHGMSPHPWLMVSMHSANLSTCWLAQFYPRPMYIVVQRKEMNSGLEVCPGCFPSGYYRAGMVVLEMWILPTCKDIIRTWLALLPPCNTAMLLATQVGHHWRGVPSVWPTFHRKGAAEGNPDLLPMHRTLLSLACRQCSSQSPAAFSTIIRRVTDDLRGRLHFGSRLQRDQSTIVD